MGFVVIDDNEKVEPKVKKNFENKESFNKAKVVGCGRLAFRKEPEGEIIDHLTEGTVINMSKEMRGPWVKIRVGDKNGWVMIDYLQKL